MLQEFVKTMAFHSAKILQSSQPRAFLGYTKCAPSNSTICRRRSTMSRVFSTTTCTRSPRTHSSISEILKKFDQLNPDQKSYLDRIRADYAAAFGASFSKHNTASERFVTKFSSLNAAYSNYCHILDDIAECHDMLEDEGMEEVAKMEIGSLTAQLADSYLNIQEEITEKLAATTGDILLEIRMAVGGLESSLFCHDLKNLYHSIALSKGYSWNVIEEDARGIDNGIARFEVEMSGEDVFQTFQFEAGVHRVQRVPVNDSRVHTSTAIVLVTLKPDDIDIEIHPDDVEVVFTTAQGPGGQFVNKTKSKCIMKHKPSGFGTSSQVHRVAETNRKECLKKITHMLVRQEMDLRLSQTDQTKKAQALHGNRSDKMRTYNYRADKIIDHRYKVSISGIQPYFSNPEKFLGFHKEVSLGWQLQKLAEITSDFES